MTAPIIQPINSPIAPLPPSTVESWNNITSVDSWNNVNVESDSLNLLPTNENPLPTDEEESYNHEDYEEMSEDDDEETNDSYTSASSEDLPELEEQTNPANFLEWRDRHIERNFCSYNDFHDYITAYNILYDEYFGMQALH